MTSEQDKLQAELAELNQIIADTRRRIEEILPDEQIAATLAPLQAQAAALQAQLIGSGAIAQGKGAKAMAPGAIDASGATVHGDVTTTIYQGDPTDNPAEALRIYRRVVASSQGHLSLHGLDVGASNPEQNQRPLSLAHVYVDLDTRERMTRVADQKERAVTALEAASQHDQLVLLGDPGGGKSTFVHHLAVSLAAYDSGGQAQIPTWSRGSLLPLVIILRDFARQLPDPLPEAAPHHLWHFIEKQLQAQNLGFAAKPIQQELEAGRCLLLLDGLDEVVTVPQRVFVREAVMAFIGRYHPHNRCLVTCRTLSYQQPDVRLPQFATYELAPFDAEKIDRFIQAWYAELVQVGTLPPSDREAWQQQLQTAVRRPDLWSLATNPLLLTVMAMVHTHKGRLPGARALLYEETIEMLLWRWEQIKAGREGTPLLRQLLTEANLSELDLKTALWQVAYEAHNQTDGDETNLADISQWQLIRTLAALREDEDYTWASRVVQMMKLRAGLLLERSPEQFAFPHRTFQEYLAGAYLSTQADFATQAAQLAAAGANWRVVILLAVGRLVHLVGDTAKPLALVAELCPQAVADTVTGWQQVWLAGEVLQEMGLHRSRKAGSLGRELVARVRERLTALVSQGQLTPRERAEAGDTLAMMGDPRPGVGVVTVQGKAIPEIALCYIPPGPFWMGSGEDEPEARKNEKPQHQLDIPYGYWLGQYPVTVGQWQAFVSKSGHRPVDKDSLRHPLNRPVRRVTWREAVAFCAWLTEQVTLPEGMICTLPSEAEWEKAARGGIEIPEEPFTAVLPAGLLAEPPVSFKQNPRPRRRYPWGDRLDGTQANYKETGIEDSCSVGCFPHHMSAYGVMDMAGNVFEWTRSRWGEDWQKSDFNYPYDPTDGREDLQSHDHRVVRGGGWSDTDAVLRCAYRRWYDIDFRFYDFGFRVCVRPHFSTPL